MRLTRVRAWALHLPLAEGSYGWADGKRVDGFDSTVVALDTDAGLTGWGEVCPLGPAYLPAYAAGARTGIATLAAALLGADPTRLGPLNLLMDRTLQGHPYVKSALDIAAHDLLGKAAGLPVCELLGGRHAESVPLYRAVSQETPELMAERVAGYRADGYARFQLKVGGRVADDIARIRAVAAVLAPGDILVADANTGWSQADALRVVAGVADIDVFIEQPCASYEACLAVRRQVAKPVILDEVIDGLPALLRGLADGAMDAVNLKISKVGGLSAARVIRDVAVARGLPLTIEDSWGGDIATAAIAHLAQSTPERLLFSTTDFNGYGTLTLCPDAPRRDMGRLSAGTAPGLGVTPDLAVLGAPLVDVGG